MSRHTSNAHTPVPLHRPLPPLTLAAEDHSRPVPDASTCRELWRQYAMLPNIAAHSEQVAAFAEALAVRAVETGKADMRAVTRAAGLLHDIAKSYTVRYGGSHAQLGASWVMTHTANPLIAQAVLHHVWWPWPFPGDLASPVFFVMYADKRVMHDTVVDLETRFADLINRYGASEAVMTGNAHANILETALSAFLEIPLHACTLAGGRLVERA